MSLFKSIGRAVGAVARVVAPVASVIPGGQAIGATAAVLGRLGARSSPPPSFSAALPVPGLGMLPTLPAVGGAVVAGGALVARSAAAIGRAAVHWCRRNPAWCSSIGGTAAVASMIRDGTLPMPRRRRGRGLSARDVRGFRRTTRLIRQVAGSVGIRKGRGKSGGFAGGHTIVQN